MNSPVLDERHECLVETAGAARAALEASRSDRLLRLFDYLLAKSLVGEVPSEQQIALDVFSAESAMANGQDPNVRVYVHRLRKVLESVFAEKEGPKLQIPVGEYRIRVMNDGDDDGDVARQSTTPPRIGTSLAAWRRVGLLAGLAVVLLVAGTLGWQWLDRAAPPLAQTLVWQAFDQSDRPLVVVAGDYYLFASVAGPGSAPGEAPQLIWDKSVPTREDLTILQMLDPAQAHTVVDYNQQFVSAGTIEALASVRSVFSQLPALRQRSVRLVAASQLTPELLKSSDIIYVGLFSGMPALLRDPLEQASRFQIEPGFDGLTDQASAQRYQSDGMVLTDERIARRDFAYLASSPGPAGNRLLVIAGVGEAGLKEAALLAGNLTQMKSLGLDPGRRRSGFEALYRVRTIKNVNVGATPLFNRPLRSAGIWDNSGNVAPYRPFDGKAEPTGQP
ncbi:MAG: hypothetical protein KKD64_06900 [Alphaproteobacteria bacterium]|nr:hypothetical protein [Alphaproteobacteria bacterium]MBU0795221.1 hypothetical protein [Alphaproteobacteria bacterium]MBU0876663.1 hypothetical protein [Alphaproteobacteria bacterium]MBU1769365.1 hypothetical protein [Alphaproteobacteria bacterium]